MPERTGGCGSGAFGESGVAVAVGLVTAALDSAAVARQAVRSQLREGDVPALLEAGVLMAQWAGRSRTAPASSGGLAEFVDAAVLAAGAGDAAVAARVVAEMVLGDEVAAAAFLGSLAQVAAAALAATGQLGMLPGLALDDLVLAAPSAE